jgi:iron-sulfur cluster repair protein YtfE (RIC family)
VEATQLLRKDHDTVRELFQAFELAHAQDDTARMLELATTVCAELDVHAEIEEQIFYPAVRDQGGDDVADTIAEAFEEHHVAKVLIGEIRDLEPTDEAFAAKVTVLRESVEHHADEEETELFPQVRELFEKVALLGLGRRMEERRFHLREEAGLELDLTTGEPEPATAAADDDLESLTKADLYEKAKEQEIEGRSTMTKQELVEAIRHH